MSIAVMGCAWLLSLVVQSGPSPSSATSAGRETPPLELRVGQTAPPLEDCEWTLGLDGVPPGAEVDAPPITVGTGFGSTGVTFKKPARGAPSLEALHGSVVVISVVDSHAPEMVAKGLPMLRDLATAASDREFGLVLLCEASDVDGAQRAIDYAGPIGAFGHPRAEASALYSDRAARGAHATFVVGRSGELIWMGDVVGAAKDFAAAVDAAFARRAAPRIDRTLSPTLEPALAEYWSGRFEKARALFARAAKAAKDDVRVLEDAKLALARIDAHEADVTARVRSAAATDNVEALVELEAILEAGFEAPTRRIATEELKRIDNRTLMAGRTTDARKWRELAAQRPLFFPARADSEGKRYAKDLQAFLKATVNQTPAVHAARALLDRFERLR